ncbi:MAG: hypothetical protein M1839_005596 [Geoglossum umbratile]|nr:MAG: hypothetical protein M1839_005596 [Geoglossum umbratile]
MIPAGVCIVISVLVFYAFGSAIEPQAFVPVSVRPTRGSNTEIRDLRDPSVVLQPRQKVELLYAQHGSDGTNPFVVTVTASHKNTLYVLVEDFEDSLSEIHCVNDTDSESTSMVLRFKDGGAFRHARSHWTSHDRLLFITHHSSCNEGHKRGVYKSSSIRFEEMSLDVAIICTYEELGDSSHASSLIRVTGGLADAHLIDRLRRRTVYPRNDKSIKSKISAFSFNIHQDFPPRDHVLEFSGTNIYCVNCSVEGVIETTFNFTINTDIAGVLKGLGDGIKYLGADAEKALEDLGDGVNSVAKGILDVFKKIGKSIGDFFRNIASRLGLARRDTNSSALGFLKGVVQELSFTINDTTPVAAKFNIELSSNSLVALPGALVMTLGPRFQFGSMPAPFKVRPRPIFKGVTDC